MNNSPKVTVATLTWNQKEDVLECLSSLVKLDYPNYEIVVVDNGSSDGTFEAVRSQFPGVRMVRHTENLGCAEGVNGEIRAALQAESDFLFIIANDAVVEPSTLSELVKAAQTDPGIGIVNPKVYYYGTEKKIWFARGAKFDFWRGRFYGFAQNIEDHGNFEDETEADYFPGGFSLVRTEAIRKAGFLDPKYFIFFDDSDWSRRIHQAGYSGRYAPRARAWHKPSSSVGMESEIFYYYRTRNRLYFVKKHAPAGVFVFFLIYFLGEFVFKTVPYLYLNRYFAQLKASLAAIFDFFRGKLGARDFSKEKRGLFNALRGRAQSQAKKLKRGLRFTLKNTFKKRLHIKVYVNWNIGDEIMTIPVYEALKERHPDCFLEARVRHPELLTGNPYVDRVNSKQGPEEDLYFDLHREAVNRPRSDFIREITGVTSWNEPRVYLSPAEISDINQIWRLEEYPLRIALGPSSRWFARQWPKGHWAALAEALMQSVGAQIFVVGSYDEPIRRGVDLIGKTSLRETACILSQCHLFIGSDSGPVHLSLAVGTPTIGLFGPLNPGYLITARPDFIPIWSPVECRGCWSEGRMQHPDHCPKIAPDCMSSISVERVLQTARKFLKEQALSPATTLEKTAGNERRFNQENF